MTKRTRRAAIIIIDERHLLEMMDFDGGKIHGISKPIDEWKPSTFEIILEHPDLDKVEPGHVLHKITPAYYCGPRGISRVDPPKLGKK